MRVSASCEGSEWPREESNLRTSIRSRPPRHGEEGRGDAVFGGDGQRARHSSRQPRPARRVGSWAATTLRSPLARRQRRYDLDRHVQRVLERERRLASEYVPPPSEQLSLFHLEPVVVRPNWRYETPAGLVVDDEGLFSRAVALHSAEKAYCARTYAEIVGTAMRGKWKLWWIELFAGPGRLYIRETGDFAPGSPIEAMTIRRPFSGYVFADLDSACTESLRRRVGERANVHVLRGDANSAETLDAIAAIVPKRALVVLYGD